MKTFKSTSRIIIIPSSTIDQFKKLFIEQTLVWSNKI